MFTQAYSYAIAVLLRKYSNPMYEGQGGKNTAAYISNFLLSHLRDFFLCTPALLLFNAFLSSLVRQYFYYR